MTLSFEKLAEFDHETFSPFVGDVFLVDGEIELKLLQVGLHPNLRIREGENEHRTREPFSLLFQGPELIDAGMHEVQHSILGSFPLSINPIQYPTAPNLPTSSNPNDSIVFYESVFA